MVVSLAKIKVHSLKHLDSLLKRGHHNYRLEAMIWPSGKINGMQLYVEKPKNPFVDAWIDDFGYFACSLSLKEPGKYPSDIYCMDNWNAHDIAEELAKWGS